MSKRDLDQVDGQSSDFTKQKKRRANDPTTRGDGLEGKPLTKEEKRELKRQRKASKAKKEERAAVEKIAETNAGDSPSTTVHQQTTPEGSDISSAKALRRAEKAARKEAKRLKKETSEGGRSANSLNEMTSQETDPPEVLAVTPAETTKNVASGSVGGSSYVQDRALTAAPQSEIDAFLSKNLIAITDPLSEKQKLRPITSFSYLPWTDDSQKAPFKAFSSPTPIQAASWPFLLSGRDVVGVAETGSGKTLAFSLPCVRRISASNENKKTKGAKAVIVSPTRELALQIHEQVVRLAEPAGLGTVCVYGGVQKDEQRKALRTASIVVGTPGRLNDLIDEGSANLSRVEYLVLDEADRMLDKGFEDAIKKIISSTPSNATRQTLMFTATWPQSVRELAATFMSNPVRINIGDNPTGDLRANTRISQTVEVVDPRGKETRLLQLLKQYQSGKDKDDRILVFCLYKKEATRVENFIRSKGFRVAGIHGDLSQQQRMASLDAFKTGKVPLLVATDVAARGLDIPAVKVVINVTFPLTVEDYVHRIGRTGRAGKEGIAITLFTEHDKAQSGALINVLKAANQPVPEDLLKFGTTVKKKGHEAYGAFYRDTEDAKPATKIKFDD